MKKVLLSSGLALLITLTGCSSNGSNQNNKNSQNQVDTSANQITVNNSSTSGGDTNSNLDNEFFKNGYSPFTMQESAMYTSPFQINETSLVFPNWDDNNKLSIINEPYPKDVINTSNVVDFYDYPINSLAVVSNIAYFADGNNNNGLSSIDLSNRAYTPILNNVKASNIIAVNNVLYFIDLKNGNKLHAFDTINNEDKIISTDNTGNYLVDENMILYENKSDKSTLYKINIDGTEKQKLTNFSVNSFAPYSGDILAINSSDENNLYSINLTDLSTKRLAVMNGEELKVYNGKLYFIDVNNSRHLSTMTVQAGSDTPDVSFNDISDYSVNEYYPTDKGIFAQRGVNVNNSYIFIPS